MNQQNNNAVPSELDAVMRELKMQVEVNRRLARNLIDLRLELEQLKLEKERWTSKLNSLAT